MSSEKAKFVTAGVAEGKKIVGISTGDDVSSTRRVESLLEGAMGSNEYIGWGSELFKDGLKLVSSSSNPGSVTFAYTVRPGHCNRLGNLHGGCTATLFDITTTCALAPIAKPGFWSYAGVSRTLNVTYLRPVAEGEKVLIESEVVHAGRNLCAIKGVMKRVSDGAVMATCEHNKVSIEPKL